ncbi:hypothetical protein BDR26DRAFT_913913 [Obelidium mucronatum]|nr:hypothetical protein BDR26DRAFT_913913 [Obelidium mucronatum]
MQKSLLDDLDPLSSANKTTAPDALSLAPDEAAAFAQLFRLADADGAGAVSAQTAVAFLTKSRLPQNVLGEIWVQADSEQNGFLNQQAFYRCLKLIALAQSGKPPSLQFLATPTPLPVFEGVTIPSAAVQNNQSTPSGPAPSMAPQPSASGGFQLSSEERDRFVAAFNSCSPMNGFVSGASSKDLFVKSGLSLEILSRIWTLVDTQNAMQLNLAQFMLAMLIITQMKSGALQSVPTSIPPSLLSGIANAAQSALSQQSTSVPGSVSNAAPATSPTVQPQQPQIVQSPTRLGSIGAPSPAGVAPPPSFDKRRSTIQRAPTLNGIPSNEAWAITPDEKALADSHFDNLDIGKKGFVSGQESYGFFLKSQLDQTVLAQIWDLANVSKSVGLSKDEFSVAMHLIKLAMTGVPLPETLPSNLIPPALRTNSVTSPVILQSAIVPPPSIPTPAAPVQQTAQQDLMALGNISFDKPVAPSIPQPNAAFDPRRFSTLPGGNVLSKTLSNSIPSLTDDRSADIANARAQLADLQQKRDVLLPAQEELRAKRAANEVELQKVLLKKQELTLELTQASATFEAETAIHMENLAQLQHEQQLLQLAQMEVDQAKQIVAAKLDEKNQVIAAIEAVKAEIADCKKHLVEMESVTKQYQEEINLMRPRFAEVHADLKKQMNLVEINKQLWTTVTEEHKQLKADLSREELQLDEERRKLSTLSSQVAVQTAINDKEKSKIQTVTASLDEARSLSNSQAQSLNNLNAEAARGFDIPQAQKAEKSPTVTAARPKPPPPPASRNAHGGSIDLLEKRKSLTPSVKSLDAIPAPATATEPVTAVPVVSGPPPPMPPMFTKPKAGSSLGDLLPDASAPKSDPTSTGGGDFAFDADFESAFNAIPLPSNKSDSNAFAFDEAFSLPPKIADSKAFDDAFAVAVTTVAPATSASVAATTTAAAAAAAARTPASDAFVLPLPPQAAPSMSDEGFDRLKRPSNATTASLADTASIRSGRKRINKLKSIDADAEFENAFGGAAAAVPIPVTAVASTATASGTVPVKVDDSVFDAIPGADDFNFDTAFPPAPKPADAFSALEDAFGSSSGVGVAVPAPAAALLAGTTQAAKSTGFDAFDDIPQASTNKGNVEIPPSSAGVNAVDALEAAFGTSPSKVAAELAPSAKAAAADLFDADFSAAFVVPAPGSSATAAVGETVDSSAQAAAAAAPLPEKAAETGTDDDVTDEVKELMNMGFSKEQCISALEKNEFNVAKSLNFLLDAPGAENK